MSKDLIEIDSSDIVIPLKMDKSPRKSTCKMKTNPRDNKMSTELPKADITEPLTKAEEYAMRRVRRKLKNKISAQESRRRKKEYVESLEKRVSMMDSENELLRKCLEEKDQSLRALTFQMGKIQQAISLQNKGTQTGICLKCYLHRQSSANEDFKVKTGKNGRIIVSTDTEEDQLYHKSDYTELRGLCVENGQDDTTHHEEDVVHREIYPHHP